ncbi:MFS transporter [Saxibacter everestensis]|uniref:MFS transporter n=1 Tax=Saxibacter everestensis TaxID=2909229 RepID=A0ABY8QSH2_9MICO|nr:MFS transporter [Brevibacteriaceae bacterium ZFBP1038]
MTNGDMTSTATIDTIPAAGAQRIRYGALVVIMLMSFLLVTAEFLPGGILTELAVALDITPGQAGQMVTVTALVGLIVAPTIGLIFPRLDRRSLLVWMAIAAAASNLLVAFAPNFAVVLMARFLLGAALSGFWSMSITVVSRIAGPANLGRAVMFSAGGVSVATVAGVPLGVLLSELVDWRAVFIVAGVATGVLAIALRTLLPSVPAEQAASFSVLWNTLRRPGTAIGLTGHFLVVLGHSLAYTYVRLALERVQDASGVAINAGTIVLLLAMYGVGGVLGNLVVGLVIDRALRVVSIVVPLAVAALVAAMLVLSTSVVGIGAVTFAWGFFFASWLIVVNTWVGRRMPDRLEAGGGLVVVGFQAGIMVAAGIGGLFVDALGVEAVYVAGAVALVAGSVLFGASQRKPAKVDFG